jgi:predicted TIM-barrel fold metal-dependent hydrolase
MIETDYPHPDAEFPHSAQAAQRDLAALSPQQRAKILHGNAARVFSFTPVSPASLPIG